MALLASSFKLLVCLFFFFKPSSSVIDWLDKTKDEILALRGSVFKNEKADILFLIDSSGSLWKHEFELEKKFVTNLLGWISVGYEATRIEVIPFGCSANRYMKFISEPGHAKTKCYFNERFSKLKFEAAGCTNMRDAFQKAIDVCLGTWQGKKRSPMSQFKTVVILLTDGGWNSPSGDSSPVWRAQKLIKNNAEVFAIGVGSGVEFDNLKSLVKNQKNDKTYAFHLKDFSDFNSLATYIRGDRPQKVWETVDVDRSKCSNKCDAKAKCACGLVYGDYKCACPEGMAGSGANGDCKACPHGTYKKGEGYAKKCDKCPENSSHKMTGRTSYEDCKCNPGHYGQPQYGHPCYQITCQKLTVHFAEEPNGKCVDHNGKDASSMSYRSSLRTSAKEANYLANQYLFVEVRCDKLTKVTVGYYTPKDLKCDEQSQKFDANCIYHCPDGYHMHPGSNVDIINARLCNYENGTWDGEQRSCKDHTRPELTCPKNQPLPNDKGKNTATVNWNFDFDDNSLKAGAPGISKDKFTVVIMINDVKFSKKPEQLKIGTHNVLYNVTDPDQNYRTCSFIVTVRDTEPPTCEYCPESQEIEVTNGKPFRLNWKNPNCSDNSGMPPSIKPSKRKGFEVKPPALYTIEYRVADQAKPDPNAYNNCSFTIKVTVEKKRKEVYKSLQNIDWNAFKVKSGLDLGGGADKFNLKHADGYCSEEGAVVRKCTSYQEKYQKKCNFDKGEITKCKLSPDFDLAFQDRSSAAYAEVEKIIPDIRQFTVAVWLRTTDSKAGVPLSYAVRDGGIIQDNALAIQDCSGLNLIINNKTAYLGVDINDGAWHHLAVTWQSNSGIWKTFLDGASIKTSPTPFQQNHVIRGGGVMVAGQEQDEIGGGFNSEESFIGDMSQMNLWSRVLTDNEVYNLAQTCEHTQGDIVAWADFRESLFGVYTVTPKSYACEFQNVLRYTNVIYNASIPSSNNKVLSSTSPQACAISCDVETSFPCRSFNFDKKSKKCYLSGKHSPDNLVKQDSTATYDYYELNIEECRIDNGGCSHSCHNKPGGVTCSCPRGMMLTNGKRTETIRNDIL
ncbi:hypothetical protein QZH41_006145 [Actinostola sp. cb2023]|nr:hypothetical protein QZH41_006145 [Actinostola sp. cb2023]